MSRMKLGDIYDLYRLRNLKWGYSDFAKSLSNEKFLGYGVIDVDAGGVGFNIIDEDNEIYFGYGRNENDVALRPTMSYSYAKDLVENKKEIGEGLFEVTFGEYPNSKIEEDVNSDELVKTGRGFTIKENNELVRLDEYVDLNGNKMVCLNGDYYRVEALVWLADSHKDIMITKDAINGGFAYEAELTLEEEYEAKWIDEHFPRKLSKRSVMIADKGRNDNTLANNFMRNIMYNEIVSDELLRKIAKINEEKARKEKEEKERLEQIKKEKRRLQRERTRAQRERRRLMNRLFPRDAWSIICHIPYSEEDMKMINKLIEEELPNVKNYINDKEVLIDTIIYLYKGKDGLERRMPYPESRYDACRVFLEYFDVDYLNIVLKETVGKDEFLEGHVEYLVNNNILGLRRK